MRLVPVTPGAAWLAERRPFVHLLAEAAAALGGTLELDEAFGHLGRYRGPDGCARPLFGNALGLNPEAAAMLAADKDYTARLLAAEGIATPDGIILFSPRYHARMALKNEAVAAALPKPADAEAFAAQVGYPVILKPNSGSEGRGVMHIETEEELRRDLDTLFGSDDRVRLEAYAAGQDTRLTVLDGRVQLAYRRLPPAVTGDGRRTLRQLAEDALGALARTHRGAKLSPEDPRIARAFQRQGLTWNTVPKAGRVVELLESANLSVGGRMEDLTGALPPEVDALAQRAVEQLGLRLAGVDIRSLDVVAGVEGAVVLEVNAAPGLDYYASHGPEQWERARQLLIDALAAPV
ncbi:MAG: hypothetical protein AAF865_16750 [Pseudomonadota bacterium]